MIPIEPLDYKRDAESIFRLWQEVGWLDADPKCKVVQETLTRDADARVARIDGEVECLTLAHPGSMRYLDHELSLCCVTGVTTSHVARRMGLAKRLTADLVARAACRGALVAELGVFDQGFYDLLGFGSGPCEHWVTFDPATLRIDTPNRAPIRLTKDDVEAVHANRLETPTDHGGAKVEVASQTLAEMHWSKTSFGLGYHDEAGKLTHHVWLKNSGGDCAEGGEHGPYVVMWWAYRTEDELQELLALIKSLGDQVHLVTMDEPALLQMQDLVPQPLKQRRVTTGGDYGIDNSAEAWWQARMLDVPGCLVAAALNVAEPVLFNLTLSDPISEHLPESSPWRGVAAKYMVTLGQESSAVPGRDERLPTLTASVNAFTRLWLGVRPARGLVLTDELAGPPELLDAIDKTLRLPVPCRNWEF